MMVYSVEDHENTIKAKEIADGTEIRREWASKPDAAYKLVEILTNLKNTQYLLDTRPFALSPGSWANVAGIAMNI